MQDSLTTDIGTLIEPDPIAFSFGAPGWYVLLAVLLIVLAILGVRRLMKYRKNKYRRMAMAMIESLFAERIDTDQLIFKTAELLKRVSMISFGRSQVAALNGSSWLSYMVKHDQSNYEFSPLMNKIYSSYLYQGKGKEMSEEERSAFKNESITWIKKHRV